MKVYGAVACGVAVCYRTLCISLCTTIPLTTEHTPFFCSLFLSFHQGPSSFPFPPLCGGARGQKCPPSSSQKASCRRPQKCYYISYLYIFLHRGGNVRVTSRCTYCRVPPFHGHARFHLHHSSTVPAGEAQAAPAPPQARGGNAAAERGGPQLRRLGHPVPHAQVLLDGEDANAPAASLPPSRVYGVPRERGGGGGPQNRPSGKCEKNRW